MGSRALTFEAAPLDVLLASVPSLPRAILARLTARMIERLDEMDGDSDLEDDPAGADDDLGEVDPCRPEPGFTAQLPIYVLDQRRGPTNNGAVNRAWQQYMMTAPPPQRRG